MYDDPRFSDSAREHTYAHDSLQDALQDSRHDSVAHPEGVPDDLQGVHGRLLADGGAWRRGLPSTQGIVQRARSETMRDSGNTPSGRSPVDRDPGRTRVLTAGYSRYGTTPPRGASMSAAKPLRTVAGATAALAVVALLAFLFYGFAHTRGGPATGPQPASSAATGNGWQVNAALAFTANQQLGGGFPAISPADPNTVYEATLSPVTLRRTTDAGKSWTTLKAPGDTSNLEDVQIFASPLDAKSVFLTLTTPLPSSQAATCPTVAANLTATADASSTTLPLALKRPPPSCSLQYHSTDSGTTWTQVKLPAALTSIDLGFNLPEARVLLAQGNRLYADAGCGLLCVGPGNDIVTNDIVTSADGGGAWTLADSALRAAGANICDFAPSPSGSDVFALASQQGCDNEALPPLTLWHSADAGAHWSKVSATSSNLSEGMQVVAQASGSQLLYIHMPQTTAVPHTVQMTNDATSLRVSADGGKTWTSAPSAGAPNGATPVTGPLATLRDGTVVEGMGDANAPALYGWKLGDTAWHLVAPALKGQVAQLLVIAHGSADELIAITATPSSQTHPMYAVQSYVP